MCGIAGYYGRKIIGTKNINSTAIRMRNRGPDNFAYERYIANQFRHHFGFEGTPLDFIWRKKKSTRGRKYGKKV